MILYADPDQYLEVTHVHRNVVIQTTAVSVDLLTGYGMVGNGHRVIFAPPFRVVVRPLVMPPMETGFSISFAYEQRMLDVQYDQLEFRNIHTMDSPWPTDPARVIIRGSPYNTQRLDRQT